jgi:hypothetical protein
VRYLGFQQPDEFIVAQKRNAELFDVDISLTLEKIPQFIAGSKMFLNPRLNSMWRTKLPKNDSRTQDYYFQCVFLKTDTTFFHLPDGFSPEVLPKPATFKCDYGEYESTCTFDAEKRRVISTAKLQLYHNRIPAEKYTDVKKFFDNLMSNETQKLIVKRD